MNQLVFIQNGQVFTDSLTVAHKFNKTHDNVMRDIKVQLTKLAEAGEQEWGVINIEDTKQRKERGHEQNNYCAWGKRIY